MSVFHKVLAKSITYIIALVWLLNGLYCKVLNGVPRHRDIVGQILGDSYESELTTLIGLGEIGIAMWVVSDWQVRYCAIVQIALVISMNLIETWLVPESLLWGRLNLVFAVGFCLLVWYWGRPKTTRE